MKVFVLFLNVQAEWRRTRAPREVSGVSTSKRLQRLSYLYVQAHWTSHFNPLSANITKWSSSDNCRRIVWVFDHFVGLALKALMLQTRLGAIQWSELWTLKSQWQIWHVLQGVRFLGVQFARKILACYDK